MPAFLFKGVSFLEAFLKGTDIIAQIKEIAEPIVIQKGMELVNVEYKMEHGQWILRFFIDKPGGVTVDDCGDISGELGALLDVKDIIHRSYNLEVSSPGLDRALTREKDFVNYKGRKVKIKTKEPISGRRNFSAVLDDFKEGTVFLIDSEGKKWEIPFDNIEKARLEISF